MAAHQHFDQGGATALPITQAFLSHGGRLLIGPSGRLKAAMDAARIFGGEDIAEARRTFTAARRLHRRLRNPRFVRTVTAIVVANGERTPNGWLVLEGRA